jgi:thymidylate synthase (FAD)
MAEVVDLDVKVLDKGRVVLLDAMGNDSSVVAAARVSNGRGPLEALEDVDKDDRLIKYLMKHKHGTPFEHNLFTFYVKCPIFVAREWQRHRIGSYNELSGRYTEFKPEFYIPEIAREPGTTNKQGSKVIENPAAHKWLSTEINKWSIGAYDEYKAILKYGIAKEMARMILPLNLYTEFYWSVNARSLMNFLSLRTGEDAQWEIRQYAEAIKPMFWDQMPMTFTAWVENGYQAP